MFAVQPKKAMSEEDIKRHFITPAVEAKWSREKITMETQITDGKINLRGNLPCRERPKRADYLLYLNANNPIAVIEAKDNKHTVSFGLQQAMEYAQKLDLPFAYSSNGDAFAEHDFLTGKERTFPLDAFPTETELISRFKQESNDGAGLSDVQEKLIAQPYYSSQSTYSPRYYQRIAVNRTIDAIARGQNRLLLVMATGTGKTYTAFQIVYRLLKSGAKRKILYLADRNILVDQSIQQDFAPLEKVIHKINVSQDDPTTITSHQIYFSLYQQLVGDDGKENFREFFTPDFFDLIIVDECHRGSAREESRWRVILEYFKNATQIGMTATPKETKYISNLSYFKDPIYTYSLKEGIEDGFLAPFKVLKASMNIGEGWRPSKGQRDIYGNEIEDRIYGNDDYDYNIVLEDRIREVAEKITAYLKATDRLAKTIVFCADEEAAERMRIALVNANSDMVKANPDYVVRITGSDAYGKSKLNYFISVSTPFPVIATTSKLLSTGADCKMTKLIVLDERIASMTEFKQIIGRGTRLREQDGKTHFTVMDFRNVTDLFADPDWDGPVEIDPDFSSGYETGETDSDTDNVGESAEPPPTEAYAKPVVDQDGCRVQIVHEKVLIYDRDGKIVSQENISDYAKRNMRELFGSKETFARDWLNAEKTDGYLAALRERGIDLNALKAEQARADLDDFDFICALAFDEKPLTRRERADAAKRSPELSRFDGNTRAVIEALLEKYAASGIRELENAVSVLRIDPFPRFGSPAYIVSLFGGKNAYLQTIILLKKQIYSVS